MNAWGIIVLAAGGALLYIAAKKSTGSSSTPTASTGAPSLGNTTQKAEQVSGGVGTVGVGPRFTPNL